MLHPGFDFQTVRVVCKKCGWFRRIAHSGCADGVRALVSIQRSKDPTHVLHAKVIGVSESIPLADALEANPGYHDLVSEAHQKGLIRMEQQFSHLLDDQACPRCKKVGMLELSQQWLPGVDVRY